MKKHITDTDTDTEKFVSMFADSSSTPKLTASVCEVMAKIKRLVKDGNNSFDSYKYVSIDQNKDALRPLIAEHGLEACLSQKSMKPFSTTTSKGKEILNFLCKFEGWLKHSSGEVGEREEFFSIIPYGAAQTGSILRSYAIKIYLSGKFLQSGGDDHEDPDNGTPESEEMTKADARKPYETMQREMREIGDAGEINDLDDWTDRNKILLNAMPSSWKPLLRNEHQQAKLQILAREKTAKANESLPDLAEWQSGFQGQLATATSLEGLEQIWVEHENTIDAMPSPDQAMANRLFKEAKSKMEAA